MSAVLQQIGSQFTAEQAEHHGVAVWLLLDGGVVSEVDVVLEIRVPELAVADLAGHDVLSGQDVIWVVVHGRRLVAQSAAARVVPHS